MNGVRGGLVAGALLALALGAVGCGGDDDGGGDEPFAGSGGTGGGGGNVSGSSGGGTGGTSSTPTGGGTGGSSTAGSGGTSAAGSGGSGGTSAAGSGGSGGTGEPDAGPEDAGPDATEPDPCEDIADACDTEGVTCDGDELVDCAPNDDDCLVETRTDCTGGSTDFCDDSGDPAECATCAATDCTAASATCDDDTLVVCALDANGCLVETDTNCAAGVTDYCDDDVTPAACAACAASDCTAAGTQCDGDELVTCTVDADGCFEDDSMSCIATGTNACEETSSTVAACVDDECRLDDGTLKDDVCVENVAAQCVDEVLVECVLDGEGCPIAERTDCAVDDPPNNVCDETLATPDCAFDPCVGVTDCEDEGVTCRGADRVACAPDGNLCLVETVTDCTQGGTVGETCNPGLDPPDCDTCADDPGCVGADEGDMSCDGTVLSTCTDTDGDDCLEEVLEDCGADFDCTATGCVYDGGDVCTETIDEERILRAAGSYGPFDTDGETHQYGNYVCPGTVQGVPFGAASPDLLFAIDVPANHVLEAAFVGVSGFEGSGVWMLLLPGCADSGGTQIESMCQAMSDRSISYANEGDETARIYIAVDADNVGGNPNTGVFSLSVDTRPLGCGDGEADGSEECDDGNTLSGDGCDDCMEEGDYQCTQIDPSICTRRPADGVCGNVECDPLPGNAAAAVDICCTPSAECGVAYAPIYGASCIESMPTRPTDTECDDEAVPFPLNVVFNAPPLDGCCVQLEGGGSTCGLTAGVNVGCVPRTAVWQAMLDGPGSALYTGPFLAQPCTP